MKGTDYRIYGSKGKKQLFGEKVIYDDEPGIAYMKSGNELISFISRKDLIRMLDNGPYRYLR